MVLANGGSLYIDAGKPAPTSSVKPWPTCGRSRRRSTSMSRAASSDWWRRWRRTRLSRRRSSPIWICSSMPPRPCPRVPGSASSGWLARPGRRPAFVSAWESTETAPMVTTVHFPIDRAGVIGLPAPGIALKLTPTGAGDGKREMKVKGPNVTPGYWERGGGVSPVTLDAEGFLPTGDAGTPRGRRSARARRGLRWPHRGELQAGHRHLGLGGRAPRAGDRGLRAARARCGGRGP